MWKCHQCGAENGDGGEFCATCGNRRAANAAGSAPEPAARPTWQAGIMIGAFFGGALGGAGCVLGGFLFRLVLRAFAIITEAHYRKLRDR